MKAFAMKKSACLLALAFSIAVLQSCRSEPAATGSGAQQVSPERSTPQSGPQSVRPQESVVAAPANFKKTLTGTIDGRLPIRMALERKENELSGGYYYEKPGAANLAMKTLELKGRIDDAGNATMTETSENLETGGTVTTGEFKGRLDAVSSNGDARLRFSGTWKNARDNRQLSFALTEERFDLGGLRFDEKKQTSANKRLHLEIETSLPQIAGDDAARVSKFNAAVNALVAQQTGAFARSAGEMAREDAAARKAAGEAPPSQQNSMDVSYEVVAADREFVSILFYFYEYTGGAHPNTTSKSFNYDLARNSQINLADLFRPGSNYLKVISDYCVRELKKLSTVTDPASGAGPKLENFHSWNITPAGLKITFDRYQVGAYAVGEHEVVVPYSVLKPVIKPDGLLSKFVH
jgi:hypothetical protein